MEVGEDFGANAGNFTSSYLNATVLLVLGVSFCHSLISGASRAAITFLHKSKAQKITDDHARMVPAVE
jgi:hypothetical protein